MKTKLLAILAALAATAGLHAAPKPVLEKGMAGSTIVQLVGRPDEVQPLKAPEGKAEKWIYRRKVNQTIIQSANMQAFEPAFVGNDGTGRPMLGTVVVPDYRIKYVALYQVTALLMVDGKLQLGRQWKEQEEKFTD